MRNADESDLARKLKQLEQALARRVVIEQATGMIMFTRDVSGDDAFEVLWEVSQHTNVKLHDVANVVVALGSRTKATPV